MELIAELIAQLDRLPSAEARIKVFQLKNGDATQLGGILQQLFGLPVTAGSSTTGGFLGLNAQPQLQALANGGDSFPGSASHYSRYTHQQLDCLRRFKRSGSDRSPVVATGRRGRADTADRGGLAA